MGRVNGVLMEHFDADEFKHPDKMDTTFLLFLDKTRDKVTFVFALTNDARTQEENAKLLTQGASPNSLHMRGRAVDFSWPKEKPWEEFFALTTACKAARDMLPTHFGIELELVLDKHVHLGLFPDDRSDKLIIAAD
jgi:hypothetical protein